jgi:lipid-binding SYLF domain-containing protein
MKHLLIAIAGTALMLGTVGNVWAGAKEEVNQDAMTLKDFTGANAKIPAKVLENAKGIAIFRVVDVALLVNGKGGPGIVVARDKQGWSGPAFVGMGGVGLGAQLGGKVKELVLVLNTNKALEAFSHGNVKLSADLTATAGPDSASKDAETAFTNDDIYSYAESNGVFAGTAIEGAVFAPRTDTNDDFYGQKVSMSEIMSGKVAAPPAAKELMSELNAISDGKTGSPVAAAR